MTPKQYFALRWVRDHGTAVLGPMDDRAIVPRGAPRGPSYKVLSDCYREGWMLRMIVRGQRRFKISGSGREALRLETERRGRMS